MKKQVINIKTRDFKHSFSVVVTLERFGQIQTDLSDLLEVYTDDEFPWSVNIDDLETFLLGLKKLGGDGKDLARYLTIRQKLHGGLIAGDELDICGAYLSGRLKMEHTKNPETVFVMTPDLADIFDRMYRDGGIGFTNEKNLKLKDPNKYIMLGGH